MTKTANIVHEADSQRQHVRVHLPAKIEINGDDYKIVEWSNSGASVSADNKNSLKKLNIKPAQKIVMIFDFDSFSLRVPMTAEARHTDEEKLLVGIRFVDMTARQISIMQHLVNAYVTGELSEVNDLINIVGRNNMGNPRKIPSKDQDNNFSAKIGQYGRKGLVFLVSFLLVSYIAVAIYEQMFIVEAQSATVMADGFPLTAPSQGIVSYKKTQNGDNVTRGEALLSVLSPTGTVTGADSPCDCIVTERLITKGSYVGKGEPILTLVPQNAPFFVEAFIPYGKALKIAKTDGVKIEVLGGEISIAATIESIQLNPDQANVARVKLIPNTPMPQNSYGLPVEVKIDTAGLVIR